MVVAVVVVWQICLLAFIIALAAGYYGTAALFCIGALVSGWALVVVVRKDTVALRGSTR